MGAALLQRTLRILCEASRISVARPLYVIVDIVGCLCQKLVCHCRLFAKQLVAVSAFLPVGFSHPRYPDGISTGINLTGSPGTRST